MVNGLVTQIVQQPVMEDQCYVGGHVEDILKLKIVLAMSSLVIDHQVVEQKLNMTLKVSL